MAKSGKMQVAVDGTGPADVIKELAKISGGENVFSDADTLKMYTGDMSFVPAIAPRCVVRPSDAQQVQEILKWANERAVPLVPVSSGPPHFRGDTVPSVGGAVILDLSGMKRIIKINRREQLALIEPGVTFADLIPELKKEGMRPHMPLAPRRSKSVIGSYLEKEPVIQPRHHWCSIDPLLCAQTILGSGDLLQTGSSKGLWSLEEEWEQKKAQKWWNTECYDIVKITQGSQGSISVLTWASIKCAMIPEIHRIYLAPSSRLEPLIELAYRLLRYRWGEELFIINNQGLASLLATSAQDIALLREEIPSYLLVVGIAGFPEFFPEERVAVQEKDIKAATQEFGLVLAETVPGVTGETIKNTLYAQPDETYWKQRQKGAFQDIFFATTLERTPAFAANIRSTSEKAGFSTNDVGIYIQPMVQGTSCHCEFTLPYDPQILSEVAKVRKMLTQGAAELADIGAYFYRPYGPWRDIAYSRVGGGEYAALKKAKDIFDPRGVLNPGKVCF